MNRCLVNFGPDVVVVGDPVDVVTGANLDRQTDFVLAGPLPLPWYREYDSRRNWRPGLLGWGHTHRHDRRLVFDLDGVRHVGPIGPPVGFPFLAHDAQEVTAAGLLLRRVSARTYLVRQSGEPDATFTVSGGDNFARLSKLSRGGAEIAFRYNRDGQLDSITDSLERTVRLEYERSGNLTWIALVGRGVKEKRLVTYQYTPAGNLARVIDPYNHTFVTGYDADNRQVWRRDRRGYRFRFEYDPLGRCVLAGGEDGTDEVQLEYVPEQRLTVVTRRDGGRWTYIYDAAGTVTRIIDPDGGIEQFNKDESGRVAEEVDPVGNITRRVYDGAGGLLGRVDPLGMFRPDGDETTGRPPHRVAANPAEWDLGHLLPAALIRVPEARDPVFAGLPAPVKQFLQPAPPGGSADSVCEIDDCGVVFRETFPDGTSRRWNYDENGNVTKYNDRNGSATSFEYISWNQLGAGTDPVGNRTRYAYSSTRFTTAVTDPSGTLSEYGYDKKDRMTEVRRHGVVKETYQYDQAGNLIGKRDADGKPMLTIEIGSRNLPVVLRLASGDTHTFAYDTRGRYLQANTDSVSVTFNYDTPGHRVQDIRDGFGVVHRYGAGGVKESVVLARYRVGYRRAPRELVVTDPTGKEHTIRFRGRGVVERELANSSTEVTQYGPNGRCLARVTTRRGATKLWARTYHYSTEGDLQSAEDSVRGTATFRYDAAHRLVGVRRPGDKEEEPIELDPAGNLLRMPGMRWVTYLSGNRLETVGGEVFEHNHRNHISTRIGQAGETKYHYDSRDMLVRIERTDHPDWTAVYDPLGRRAWKAWSEHKVEYFWDTDRLVADRDETGRTRVYVYADPFALVPFLFVEYPSAEMEPEQGTRYYIHTDQIGTPLLVENDEGKAVWTAMVDPYGRTAVSPGNEIAFCLRFPGHYFDPETGLHYNRFRYYDPALGRYLQSDPIGLRGGLNLYAYPSNPLSQVDVRGLSTVCPTTGQILDEEGNPKRELTPAEQADLRQRLAELDERARLHPEGDLSPEDQVRWNAITQQLEDSKWVTPQEKGQQEAGAIKKEVRDSLRGADEGRNQGGHGKWMNDAARRIDERAKEMDRQGALPEVTDTMRTEAERLRQRAKATSHKM